MALSIVPPVDLQRAKSASVTLELPAEEREASTKTTVAVSKELSEHTTASAMVILSSAWWA